MNNETLSSGERLRAHREAQGMSLRELSRRSGVDPSNLSRIERGLQRPSIDALTRLGRALGLKDLVRQLGLFAGVPSDRD